MVHELERMLFKQQGIKDLAIINATGEFIVFIELKVGINSSEAELLKCCNEIYSGDSVINICIVNKLLRTRTGKIAREDLLRSYLGAKYSA